MEKLMKLRRINELRTNAEKDLQALVCEAETYMAFASSAKTVTKRNFYLNKFQKLKFEINAVAGDISAFDTLTKNLETEPEPVIDSTQ